MEFEKDFILEDKVDFEIESRKFSYKPVTAGDELNWAHEYIEIVKKKAIQNYEKKTLCKLRNLISVPYSKDVIQKVIGINKDWKELDKDQRANFFRKMSPAIFNKIIIKINKIDSSEDEEKKNN